MFMKFIITNTAYGIPISIYIVCLVIMYPFGEENSDYKHETSSWPSQPVEINLKGEWQFFTKPLKEHIYVRYSYIIFSLK